MTISTVATVPTSHGFFKMQAFVDRFNKEHLAVFKGDIAESTDLPVRIHSECLTSEVFHSLKCDCNLQLDAALDYFETHGRGLLIYLRQEGRGIGLKNKIEAYALQERGYDTVEANHELGFPTDSRSYDLAVRILNFFRIDSVQLLTNNPLKLEALQDSNIVVTRNIPLVMQPNEFSSGYLTTKKLKLNHSI